MKWRLIVDGKLDPYYNMAVDEAIMQAQEVCAQPVLRFYDWTGNCVSIGYFQRVCELMESFDLANSQIVRRPTGGGAVIHGQDITFSVVFPQKSFGGRIIDSYRAINESIIKSIKKNEGFSILDTALKTERQDAPRLCFAQPTKYDILWNNEKIGGSAQRRKNGVVLHQSSFYYEKCIDHCSNPQSQRNTFISYISQALSSLFETDFEPDGLTALEKTLANGLLINRYSKKEWNYLR